MMAAYEQNDARDSARLLAHRTLEGLQNLDRAPSAGDAINNMYRLLQSYRSHGFYGYMEQSRPESEGSLSSLLASSDRNVGDLRNALDATFKSVFGDEDYGTAIDGMKAILRTVAYPGVGETPDPRELQRAEHFFSVLLDNLGA
jgi:hypothetical protein